MAVAFIHSADKARFGEVATDLQNEYLKGTDQYPSDITAAYKMLSNWRASTKYRETPSNNVLSFAQGSMNEGQPSNPHGRGKTLQRDRSKDKCHKCGQIGHHAWENKCEANGNGQSKERSAHTMAGDDGNKAKSASDENDASQTGYGMAFCTTHENMYGRSPGHLLGQRGELI